MPCSLAPNHLEEVIAFHGHNCPGLTIGIRIAELALTHLDHPPATDLVAISETDMCGVDAIQYLTGCTLGKGNLILRDYGKMAFSFYKNSTGKGFRAVLRTEPQSEIVDELSTLMARDTIDQATPVEQERINTLRVQLIKCYYDLDLLEMFKVEELSSPPPRPPRVLSSLVCAECGEKTMESRTRRFAGQTLCIPCFDQVEQKI